MNLPEKITKKLVKLCLRLSYKEQNSFQFDEFFHDFFWFLLTRKNYEKTREILFTFKLHSANSFQFDDFFSGFHLPEKSRETLFTFKLHSADLPSI